MPSQDHNDLLSELRSTRSVRASLKVFANTVRNRLSQALDANSGHGDFVALRSLRDDLDSQHHDGLADAISHGTSIAAEDKDADPTAPTPASNPGSLGGNVYGSKGPEDTDTYRDGRTGRNREGLTQPELDARRRQEFGAEARNREEREKNEQNVGDPSHDNSVNEAGTQRDLRPEFGTKSDPNDRVSGDVTSRNRETGDRSERATSQMSYGGEESAQQDRPAGDNRTAADRAREREAGLNKKHED